MLGAGALLNLLAAAEAAANNEEHGLGTHQIKCREPAVARCALYSAATLARLSRTTYTVAGMLTERAVYIGLLLFQRPFLAKQSRKKCATVIPIIPRTTTPQEG